jgi:short-subunit dehydrogenase
VNISSTTAKVVIPLLGAYSSSKSGLEGMSEALRRELMLVGIDVVMIEPGTVNTAMYDKGEQEDLSEFKPTEYWEAVQNFQNRRFLSTAQAGMQSIQSLCHDRALLFLVFSYFLRNTGMFFFKRLRV